jgi:hypothetical protein
MYSCTTSRLFTQKMKTCPVSVYQYISIKYHLLYLNAEVSIDRH